MDKKKIILLSITVIIAAILSGLLFTNCIKNYLFSDIRTVDINEINRQSNSGELSTIANDKIYYFSNEQDGINGIYQMDLDGSNVELLIECPNIRRLTVFEDKLYYVGLFNLYKEKQGDPWEKYGIFESDDFNSSQRIAPELSSIFDAFFFEDDFMVASQMYLDRWNSYTGDTYLIDKGEIIVSDDSEFLFSNVQISDNYSNKIYIKEYERKSISFFHKGVFIERGRTAYLRYGSFIVGETKDKKILTQSFISKGIFYLQNNNELLVSEDKKIYIVNIGEFSLLGEIDLELKEYEDKEDYDYNIQVFTAQDENIFAEVEIKNDKNRFHKRHALIINKEDGSYKQLIEYKNYKDYVLYFDENTLISLENKKIIQYSHNGSEITGEQELIQINDKRMLVIDVAGDWLFVYNGVSKGIRSTLMYKINIVTGEVVENTVPFDSTQHDAIYIDELAP